MTPTVVRVSFPSRDSGELAEDLHRLFSELAAALPPHARAYSDECTPPIDVLETASSIEIHMDVAGVPREALRIVFRDNLVLIAGQKAPGAMAPSSSYHLMERDFGRFARVVRLSGAIDVPTATASLLAGELRIVLPKRPDRRGRPHAILLSAHTAS